MHACGSVSRLRLRGIDAILCQRALAQRRAARWRLCNRWCVTLLPLLRSGKVLNEKLDVVRLTFYTVRHRGFRWTPRAAERGLLAPTPSPLACTRTAGPHLAHLPHSLLLGLRATAVQRLPCASLS